MRPALLALALLAGAAGSERARCQDRLFTNDGPMAEAGFGFAVSGLADIDADGVPDYLVGVLGCLSNVKIARVFSGATGTLIREHSGQQVGCYGMAVADLGDLDGDGVTDYGVSAIREDSPLALQAGRVYVYSGRDGSIIRILEGDTSAARFGFSLCSVGDIDQDGVPDIMVGSPWDNLSGYQVGSADVFSGATGTTIHHFVGDATEDWFGVSCAAVGDIDGDGVTELLVGAPIRWYDATGSEPAGYVRLFSGATGLPLATYHGEPPEDHYGTSVAGLEDLDGDGVGEFAIGAPARRMTMPSGLTDVGMLEVRSGATGAILFTSHGTANSKYATNVKNLGDFDGDGTDDVLVGACFCQNNEPLANGKGWFEIRSGATGAILAAKVDGKAFQSFAYAVAPLGDVTADGVPDFVVGNTFDDTHGHKTGSAWVYSGADLSLQMMSQEISVHDGGVQNFSLEAGPAHASTSYLLLGSLSGTSPGFNIHGMHVPLNPDVYFGITFGNPIPGVHVNTLGTLDAAGNAQAAVNFPAGLVPAVAVGLVLHHAYVLFGPGGVSFVSNPLPLTLQP